MVSGTTNSDFKFNNRVTFSSSANYGKPYLQTITALGDNIGFKSGEGTYVSADASVMYKSIKDVKLSPMPYLENVGYPTFTPVLTGFASSLGGSVGTAPKEGWVSNVSVSKNFGLANFEKGSIQALGDKRKLDGSTVEANIGYRWAGEFNETQKVPNASTELGIFGYQYSYDKCRDLNQSSLGVYAKLLTDNLYLKAQTGLDPMAPKAKINGGLSIGLNF